MNENRFKKRKSMFDRHSFLQINNHDDDDFGGFPPHFRDIYVRDTTAKKKPKNGSTNTKGGGGVSKNRVNKSANEVLLDIIDIKKYENILHFNYDKVLRFTHDIGDIEIARTNPNLMGIFALLKINLLYSIKTGETYSDGNKNDICVQGFIKDQNKQWTCAPGYEKVIKIKDHAENEPLACPVCTTIYIDSDDILLSQFVSGIPMTVDIKDNPSIRVYHPQIILTPICPNCYANGIEEQLGDCDLNEDVDVLDTMNISPISSMPNTLKGVVPLLPICFIKRMYEEDNVLSIFGAISYWPTELKDIICETLILEMQEDYEDSEGEDE